MIKDEIFSLLQYSYHIIGEMTAKKIEKKVNRENKRFYCRIFLSLLLLCNSFYGIAAWSKDSTAEHIYFLVMGGIIFLTNRNGSIMHGMAGSPDRGMDCGSQYWFLIY